MRPPAGAGRAGRLARAGRALARPRRVGPQLMRITLDGYLAGGDWHTVRYEITERRDYLRVRLDGTSGLQDQLLVAFQECQRGRCSGPTTEYEKLDALEIDASNDEVELRLKPKPGDQLAPGQIARCLDYTIMRTAAPT